jgi:hypothetical protein
VQGQQTADAAAMAVGGRTALPIVEASGMSPKEKPSPIPKRPIGGVAKRVGCKGFDERWCPLRVVDPAGLTLITVLFNVEVSRGSRA